MNFLYRLIWILRKFAYRIFPCKTVGVRALVFDKKKNVLLVRHTYLPGWYTPGGTLNYNETPKKALKRELYEETNIIVKEDIKLFGIYLNKNQKMNDLAILYIVNSFEGEAIVKDTQEICEIGWFSLNNLPKNLSPSTQKRLEEYQKKQDIDELW